MRAAHPSDYARGLEAGLREARRLVRTAPCVTGSLGRDVELAIDAELARIVQARAADRQPSLFGEAA